MALESPYDMSPIEVGTAGFGLRLSPHLQFPEFIVARLTYEARGRMMSVDLDRSQAAEMRDWLEDWLSA